MRWMPFFIWVSVTIGLILMVLSDFAFGLGDIKLLVKRIGLFASLSRPGREILFNYGRKL
jgi:hypothetical protein